MVTGPSRIPTAPRSIEYVRLSDLIPAVRNPKEHDLEGAIASIEDHGFADASIIDERTQRLVVGHGRTEALVVMKGRGLPIPDGIMVDEDGEWLVPLQRGWRSRNDADAEAFIIRHNKLVEAGGWNDRMLAQMLHDVHAADAALFDGMGFTADELDDLWRVSDPGMLDTDPDEPDPGPAASVADMPAKSRITTCPNCFHEFIPGEDR